MDKRTFWEINATVISRKKVVFDEPVTEEDAIDLFLSQDYADIIDEEDIQVLDATIGDDR